MSSKTTLLLSDANEHWYYDCSDDTFCLELNTEHLTEIPDKGARYNPELVVVSPGTALHKALKELQRNLYSEKQRDTFGY